MYTKSGCVKSAIEYPIRAPNDTTQLTTRQFLRTFLLNQYGQKMPVGLQFGTISVIFNGNIGYFLDEKNIGVCERGGKIGFFLTINNKEEKKKKVIY